jgi:hypothetical protein
MSDQHHDSEIRVSNWTLATGRRPGKGTPAAVGPRRINA